jgi:hypothetical protein
VEFEACGMFDTSGVGSEHNHVGEDFVGVHRPSGDDIIPFTVGEFWVSRGCYNRGFNSAATFREEPEQLLRFSE